MSDLNLYRQLGTPSRRAIKRVTSRFGKPYTYKPRGDLLTRLARDNGLSLTETYQRLMDERQYLIRNL